MKKWFKKVCTGAMAVALVFIMSMGTVSAATAPSSVTVQRTLVLNDIITNHDHGFTIFTTTDGQTIYCMDIDKKALIHGQTASLTGNGDAGLLYILQNGYPNKEITGNDNVDMYITQAVVWWYLDESKLSDEFKNAGETDIYKAIPKYIKPMVEKARKAKDTQATPSMSVVTNGTTLTLTNDKKYYESNYMSAALVGAKTYNVSLTGATDGAAIVDEDGNVGTTLDSSERFKVRVPATEVDSSLDINVKFYANGTVQKAKIYKPSDNTYQRAVGLYDEVTPLSKTVALSVNPDEPDKHVCEFTDDKYYGKDGTVVDKETYDEECGNVCEFVDNKYYGINGTVVDKATFDKECGDVVTVPNTNADVSGGIITLGIILISAGAGVILHRRKLLV